MESPYIQVTKLELYDAPEIVEQFTHWSGMLMLNIIVRRDKRDGAWLIVVVWKNAPDIFLEFDYKGRFLTFYSNILTEFDSENENLKEQCYEFILEVLNRQSYYQTVRICAGKSKETENHMIKIYSKYRVEALSMQLLSTIIFDAKKLLDDVQKLIVEFQLPEIWREMEGEPSTDKYNLNFHYVYT